MKVLLIRWIDSTRNACGWTTSNDIDLIEIETIGFCVEEDDEKYTITSTVGSEGDFFDAFMIPKGCVKEVHTIYEKEDNSSQVQQLKGAKRQHKIRLKKGS